MSSNTLTGLIPTIVKAADVVSRELVGFIPSVEMNAAATGAAKDQVITYPIVGEGGAAEDLTPAATGPDPAAETITTGTMAITKVKGRTFFLEAEEELGLGGIGSEIMQRRFEQKMRLLANEVEADLAALYIYASRAYGAAATAPFPTAGNYADAAQILKILLDNGASPEDISLIINTTAGANIRTFQAQAHIAGSPELQRQGVLQNFFGMNVRESAQVKTHTAGNVANATTNAAGYAIGDKTITLAAAGTGAILTGDILVSARDTNKYVVGTGDADVSGGGTFVINNPGLRQARTTATDALTVTATYTANMAFARSAIHLLLRAPAMPTGGDSADDVVTITDARSGIPFQVAMYRQRRRVAYEVSLAWGVKAVKPEHIAILIS